MRALGCGRSSKAELRIVTPPVPVRIRPVTPKRMRYSPCPEQSAKSLSRGRSGFGTLATHHTTIYKRHRAALEEKTMNIKAKHQSSFYTHEQATPGLPV
jgi:hypothetical protein